MADLKISALAALAGVPAAGDLLPLVDVSDPTSAVTGTTKKVTVEELGAAIVTFLPYRTELPLYNGDMLDLSAITSQNVALFLSPDETKLFVLGTNTDLVYQFTLATPGLVSTATLDGSLDCSGIEANIAAMTFNAAGTRMYIAGQNTDAIYQFNLAAPWDLVTNAPTNAGNASVAGQTSLPHGLLLSPDGTKMLVSSSSSAAVYEYNLSTPGEVIGGSLSYASQTFAATLRGMRWADRQDGTPGGTLIYASSNTIVRRRCPTPYSIAGSVVDGTPSWTVHQGQTGLRDLHFTADGRRMYVVGNSPHEIHCYHTALAVPSA